MSAAIFAVLSAARRSFIKLALTAPLQRGAIDSMLTGSARVIEGLFVAIEAGDADELAEQVARVRQVAELWAGVAKAVACLVPGAVVLCKPCHAAQEAEPVVLPAKVATDTCARCGESFVPVRAAEEPAS